MRRALPRRLRVDRAGGQVLVQRSGVVAADAAVRVHSPCGGETVPPVRPIQLFPLSKLPGSAFTDLKSNRPCHVIPCLVLAPPRRLPARFAILRSSASKSAVAPVVPSVAPAVAAPPIGPRARWRTAAVAHKQSPAACSGWVSWRQTCVGLGCGCTPHAVTLTPGAAAALRLGVRSWLGVAVRFAIDSRFWFCSETGRTNKRPWRFALRARSRIAPAAR